MTALEWALEFLRTETPEAERAVVDRIFAAGAEAQRESDASLFRTNKVVAALILSEPLVSCPK